MKSIHAWAYRQVVLSRTDTPELTHPMARRLTALQKASLLALSRFQKESGTEFERLFGLLEAPLLFATAFGETEASAREAADIAAGRFPVSPAAFQHSVQNCVPGYAAIFHGLHAPMLTVSSGFLALDKALLLGRNRIVFGVNPAVVILAAHEATQKEGPELAHAELLVLHDPRASGLPHGALELLDVQFSSDTSLDLQELHEENFHSLGASLDTLFARREAPSSQRCPVGYGPEILRAVRSQSGECLLSRWRILP